MRYERKFPSQHLSYAALEQLIVQHPLGFRKIFPDRPVNNVYFDTPDRRTFYENLGGISERTKFRLRWYGPPGDPIRKATFELKKKENLLGTKINHSVEDKVLWEDIALLPGRFAETRDMGLLPNLVNTYHRAYYLSASGHFRLTLDRQMQSAPYLPYGLFPTPFPEQLQVVELKYEQEHDHLLDAFTQYWPLRVGRFSKYVNGMQLVYGG